MLTYQEASESDLEDLISASAALEIRIEHEKKQAEDAKKKNGRS